MSSFIHSLTRWWDNNFEMSHVLVRSFFYPHRPVFFPVFLSQKKKRIKEKTHATNNH